MGNFLLVIQLLTTLMPFIHQTILSLESLIPQSGQGQLKLATAKSYIQTAFIAVGTTALKFEHVWPMVQVIINTTVSALNAARIVSAKVVANVGKIEEKVGTVANAVVQPIAALATAGASATQASLLQPGS